MGAHPANEPDFLLTEPTLGAASSLDSSPSRSEHRQPPLHSPVGSAATGSGAQAAWQTAIQGGVKQLSTQQVRVGVEWGFLDETTMLYDATIGDWRLIGEVLATPDFQAAVASLPIASVPAARTHAVATQGSAPEVTGPSLMPSSREIQGKASTSAARTSPRWGRWLLLSAALAGVTVFLYRSDHLYEWSKLAGVERTFVDLEQKWLGGPAVGTTRGMQEGFSRDAVSGAQPSPLPAAEAAKKNSEEQNTLDTAPRTGAAKDPDALQPATTAVPEVRDISSLPSVSSPPKSMVRRSASPRRSAVASSTPSKVSPKPTATRAVSEPTKSEERKKVSTASVADKDLNAAMRKVVSGSKEKKQPQKPTSYDPMDGTL